MTSAWIRRGALLLLVAQITSSAARYVRWGTIAGSGAPLAVAFVSAVLAWGLASASTIWTTC